MVRPFFERYYRDEAGQMEDLATFMLSGLFWDALLRYGEDFESIVRGDTFQRKLQLLLSSVLPVRTGHAQ